jgi:hypothetical protein
MLHQSIPATLVYEVSTWPTKIYPTFNLLDIPYESRSGPWVWIVPLVPVHTTIMKLVSVSLCSTQELNSQGCPARDARVSRPRTTEDDIVLSIKEVGYSTHSQYMARQSSIPLAYGKKRQGK